MTATVAIQFPNRDRVIEGVLTAFDRQTMRLTVRVEGGVEPLRPNMLAQAMLMVGGAPRKLTVLVNQVDATTIHITPVSGAQPSERRKRKRYPVNMLVEIEVGRTLLSARIVNLSISGLGFQAPQPLEVGQEFTAILPLLGKEEALQARAHVRHCRELPNGLWYIGAAFVGLNRTDELWLRKLFP